MTLCGWKPEAPPPSESRTRIPGEEIPGANAHPSTAPDCALWHGRGDRTCLGTGKDPGLSPSASPAPVTHPSGRAQGLKTTCVRLLLRLLCQGPEVTLEAIVRAPRKAFPPPSSSPNP